MCCVVINVGLTLSHYSMEMELQRLREAQAVTQLQLQQQKEDHDRARERRRQRAEAHRGLTATAVDASQSHSQLLSKAAGQSGQPAPSPQQSQGRGRRVIVATPPRLPQSHPVSGSTGRARQAASVTSASRLAAAPHRPAARRLDGALRAVLSSATRDPNRSAAADVAPPVDHAVSRRAGQAQQGAADLTQADHEASSIAEHVTDSKYILQDPTLAGDEDAEDAAGAGAGAGVDDDDDDDDHHSRELAAALRAEISHEAALQLQTAWPQWEARALGLLAGHQAAAAAACVGLDAGTGASKSHSSVIAAPASFTIAASSPAELVVGAAGPVVDTAVYSVLEGKVRAELR